MGSPQSTTERQVDVCAALGCSILRVTHLDRRWLTRDLARRLRAAGRVVITTAGSPQLGSAASVAATLAAVTREAAELVRPAGLVVTGGEIMAIVCDAFGSDSLDLHGQIELGLPVTSLRTGPWRGLPLVTKAGGFGGAATLLQAMSYFGR